LVPLECKRNFLEVSWEIVERVDPVFFSDPMTAAMKPQGMT
jgi:ATP-dependent Lon protease